MKSNPLRQLTALGQSVWLDDIHRDMFANGQLRRLIEEDGLSGMTSNPAIFEHAIDHGADYDADIGVLAAAGKSAREIYERLSQDDVRQAADQLHGVFTRSAGRDGYVSLEVDPHLARERDATIAEARRLWAAVDRPNLYIKVPGTTEGLEAIRQLISEGINVNVTLLFGLPRYRQVMEAYQQGLEQRFASGRPIGDVSSVASFFVSRIDTLVDSLLESRAVAEDAASKEQAASLRGQVAIACAKLAFELHRQVFGNERFRRLAAHGARPQRLLWASTGTKNPAYSDVKYVEALLGAATINTMPLKTLEAYRDHGRPQLRLSGNLEEARQVLARIRTFGIDIDQVARQLELEGIDKFIQPFETLLQRIASKAPAPAMARAAAETPAPGVRP